MSTLFSPFPLGGLTLTNRIVIAPMCQYSARDGIPTDWHLIHLGQFVLSGAGLLITEATAVEPAGRVSPYDLGIWSEAHEDALRILLRSLRAHSAMPIAVQLAHAGRKASTTPPWEGGAPLPDERGGWPVCSASPLPYDAGSDTPRALDEAGLARIVEAFRQAARRALASGFDAIELHCAHGYLLHQFLSPLSNTRSDRYGGSLENRMRLPLAVFQAIRAELPAKTPLGVRISATDWVSGGWDLEQSVHFARALTALGCSYIHVSSGGLSPDQRIGLSPGYQVPFAQRIRSETGLPTIAVGLVTHAQQAEDILAAGQADLIALGRAMLYDPRWPWHAAAQLGARVQAPPQYLRCQPREVKDLFQPNGG